MALYVIPYNPDYEASVSTVVTRKDVEYGENYVARYPVGVHKKRGDWTLKFQMHYATAILFHQKLESLQETGESFLWTPNEPGRSQGQYIIPSQEGSLRYTRPDWGKGVIDVTFRQVFDPIPS